MKPLGRLRPVILALFAMHAVALGVQVHRENALVENPLALRVQRLASGKFESLGQIARGRPLLVIFWTTWCQYCAEELGRGAGLAERLGARPAPVEVFFLNVREHASTVSGHPAIEAVSDRIGLDPNGRVARALGVRGYPSWVLLGSRGEVLWFGEGLGGSIEREVSRRLRRDGRSP